MYCSGAITYPPHLMRWEEGAVPGHWREKGEELCGVGCLTGAVMPPWGLQVFPAQLSRERSQGSKYASFPALSSSLLLFSCSMPQCLNPTQSKRAGEFVKAVHADLFPEAREVESGSEELKGRYSAQRRSAMGQQCECTALLKKHLVCIPGWPTHASCIYEFPDVL